MSLDKWRRAETGVCRTIEFWCWVMCFPVCSPLSWSIALYNALAAVSDTVEANIMYSLSLYVTFILIPPSDILLGWQFHIGHHQAL